MCRTTSRIEELEPGLDETAFYDPKNFTFPSGATSPKSRSIPIPARSRSCSFTASDDFGRIVNPMIVEGQVHGGLAQGIGQALLEAASTTRRPGSC
jgi:carbon-monoxide dehydrogenase large subunit